MLPGVIAERNSRFSLVCRMGGSGGALLDVKMGVAHGRAEV